MERYTCSATIPSCHKRSSLVQQAISSLVEASRFEETDLFGVKLVLEEALTNAIRHGNKNDPNKKVEIECIIDNESFTIVVEDEGIGFDPRTVPDPTLPENLEKPGGRGLLLMMHYMSNVYWNERGNRLTMRLNRTL